MHRRDFGGWGLELSDDEFAQALAAAGLFLGARVRFVDKAPTLDAVVLALGAIEPREGPAAWVLPGADAPQSVPAAMFRDAWRKSGLQGRVRFEVQTWGGGSPRWLVEQLSQPPVGAPGIYARVDEPAVDVTWEWPLWIGLLGDERSQRYRRRVERIRHDIPWLSSLVSLVALDRATAECDLLLLPHDLRSALAAVASAGFSIRADCTIILGRATDGDSRLMAQMAGIRGVVRTSGVALAHVPRRSDLPGSDLQMWWLYDFLREMSHNTPLDVALLGATRSHVPGVTPLLVGSRGLIQFTRLAVQVRRMASRYKAMAKADDAPVEIERESATSRTFGMSGAQPRSRVGDELEKAAAVERHESEEGLASATVEMAPGAAAAPTRRREFRFLQARTYDLGDGANTARERRRALRPLAPHEIRIRIAPPDREWIAEKSTVFPDEELPPDQPEYRLTVVLTDASYDREPQVQSIILPSTGPSSDARFYVRTEKAGSEMEWRVAVAYGNRVLQTALLQAPVAEADANDSGIVLVPEASVRPTFEDLHERSRFDAALVLNHTPGGAAGVLVVEDEDARSFRVSPGMQEVLDWFDKQLTAVARQRSMFDGGLDSPASLDLLRLLAQQGASLYRNIVNDGIGDGALARGPRLHVVAATPDARMPLEFVYDRDGPRDDAKLCEAGRAALAAAAESGADTLPSLCVHDDGDASVVCPLAFWGVQKVIERHRHDRALRQQVAPGEDFLLRAEPARDRKPLVILRAAVAGANYRVNKTGMTAVCERLKKATSTEISPVAKWEDWTAAVKDTQPSILVAIVHNEKKQNTVWTQMEIGQNSWVDSNGFGKDYFRPRPSGPDPVLLLLACESGSADVTFNSFVAKARQDGAAMVVAAGAQIHEAHAVTVTCELIDALESGISRAAAAGKEVTFGDVFRNVRRALLARGVLMVLTLETYGDADWRLEPAH